MFRLMLPETEAPDWLFKKRPMDATKPFTPGKILFKSYFLVWAWRGNYFMVDVASFRNKNPDRAIAVHDSYNLRVDAVPPAGADESNGQGNVYWYAGPLALILSTIFGVRYD
jgi:hypothetical protein